MHRPEILLGMRPSNCNRQSGCVAESIVTAELLKRDWVVSTPEGDYAPYDKIATKNKFIKKIQVKSSDSQRGSTYRWTMRSGARKTTVPNIEDIDIYVFVALRHQLFLIIPYDLIIGKKTFSFPLSNSCKSPWVMHVNAWGLLENKGYTDVI